MVEPDLFFTVRKGLVWACWLDGKPSVLLGSPDAVLTAMHSFIEECDDEQAVEPISHDAEVPSGSAPRPFERPPADPKEMPHGGPWPSLQQTPPPAPKVAGEYVRKDERRSISVAGRVRTRSGARDVMLEDISEKGCRFIDPKSVLDTGTLVTIKIGEVGPLDAKVQWRVRDYVGVEFLSPLYPSVMEHLHRAHGKPGSF